MSVLQAVVAIPLASHGELVGILTLGQRITGGAYGRRETETLFNLASHLAAAIRDIGIHHQLQYQKEFNERILQRMSSGVITIGPEQRVVIMNRRAEEILGMAARDVLNRDLRALPSPLGDLLYETLSRGRSVTRSEIQLALRSLPLEVSTYPVMGEGTAPMGAVLVFEDLTAQRQLAMERRAAEQLQLLTRVVARIADEIKNPLVSINAFMELLGERYDDVSFRITSPPWSGATCGDWCRCSTSWPRSSTRATTSAMWWTCARPSRRPSSRWAWRKCRPRRPTPTSSPSPTSRRRSR
jgi:PAS domain S-box-containing protein